jgi:hypothetical protein
LKLLEAVGLVAGPLEAREFLPQAVEAEAGAIREKLFQPLQSVVLKQLPLVPGEQPGLPEITRAMQAEQLLLVQL